MIFVRTVLIRCWRRRTEMRLFVAVELSEEMKNSLIGMMHEMKKAGVKGSYAPKQNLHMTLAFIGETDDVSAVKAALKTVAFKPFRITLSEKGCFGDILYVGVKGNQGLSGAVKNVRAALSSAGVSFDSKKFTPHVTIIRKAAGPYANVKVPAGDMMVKNISLMKSEEKNGKRVYTTILTV